MPSLKKSKRKTRSPKPCAEGKIRNEKGRCVNIKKSPKKKTPKSPKKKKSPKACKEGQIRNEKGRCVKIKKSPKKKTPKSPKKKKSPKACKEGQIRNEKGRCVKIKKPKSSKKKSSSSPNSSIIDEYLNIFLEEVDQLPFITYEEDILAGDEPYTREMLIEDIVNIIKEIYDKSGGYVVVPDSELMMEIANNKFDNHKKDINEFMFGTRRGEDSIFDAIRNFTEPIEKRKAESIERRYKDLVEPDSIKSKKSSSKKSVKNVLPVKQKKRAQLIQVQ